MTRDWYTSAMRTVGNLIVLLLFIITAASHSPHSEEAEFVAEGVCNPQPAWEYKSPITEFGTARVWYYGDSITVQTAAWLNLNSVAVDAYSGRSTREGLDELRDLMASGQHRPTTIILALGTNDRSDLPEFKSQVARAQAMISSSIRIVWVNLYSEVPPTAAYLNGFLKTQTRLDLVDWDYVNRRDRVDYKSPYVADGIHPTPLGCEVRNTLIRRSLGWSR